MLFIFVRFYCWSLNFLFSSCLSNSHVYGTLWISRCICNLSISQAVIDGMVPKFATILNKGL